MLTTNLPCSKVWQKHKGCRRMGHVHDIPIPKQDAPLYVHDMLRKRLNCFASTLHPSPSDKERRQRTHWRKRRWFLQGLELGRERVRVTTRFVSHWSQVSAVSETYLCFSHVLLRVHGQLTGQLDCWWVCEWSSPCWCPSRETGRLWKKLPLRVWGNRTEFPVVQCKFVGKELFWESFCLRVSLTAQNSPKGEGGFLEI